MSATPNRRALATTGIWKGLHPGMAWASKGMVLWFVVFTVLFADTAGAVFSSFRAWIEATLGWYYVATICLALVTTLALMFSRFGGIRLGDDDSRPEFSTFSWLSMLFSAGVGIGLLFFSIAEPLFYFDNSFAAGYPNNPHADRAGALALDELRAIHAMRITYLHWGIHGWAAYVIAGLCLAYFGFRKKLPLTLRSALHPLIGERIYGPAGDAADLLAVFGTVFWVATSLGLGSAQMATGLNVLFGLDPGLVTQIALIAVISAAATLSAVSGVDRGIRILSEWNIRLTLVLLAYFVFFGPLDWLPGFVAASFVDYVRMAVPAGLWIASEGGDAVWQSNWTIFYWGWWISWAPFVGLFIARISRGRTLRSFVAAALFVPTTLALIWIGVFGGSAIYLELNAPAGVGTAGIVDLVRGANYEAALYSTIDQLTDLPWLSWAMSALATMLLATWLVRHLLGFGHTGHHDHAQHGRPPSAKALPHRLGRRPGSGRRRAASRGRPARPADRLRRRRAAGQRGGGADDRRAREVAGPGLVRGG